MKNCILSIAALIMMLVATSLSGQGSIGGSGNPGTSTGNPTPSDRMVCCKKIYVETPSLTGGVAKTRLLSGNPFKGKNAGLDLTFDVVDAKGNPVSNGWSVGPNAAGDYLVKPGTFTKGMKYRLRLRAGKNTEFYALN